MLNLSEGNARLVTGRPAASLARNLNERLILTVLREAGPLSSADIARRCAFSAQTASVLTRALEADGLIARCEPVKGKVGKPSIPVALSSDGAFAFGLRIGRRGSELVLLDLLGAVRGSETLRYDFPTPRAVEDFVREAMERLSQAVPPARRDRIVGIGVGAPNELWNWLDILGAPHSEMRAWEGHSFEAAFAAFTDLPVHVGNDATMACNGERVAGIGRETASFVYFHVGAFAGGGLVLNGTVYEGQNGNAGALGSLPMGGPGERQLIEVASVHVLERRIAEATGARVPLWGDTPAWATHRALVDDWIGAVAPALANAAVAVACILDLQDVVIDGGYPRDVAQRMADATIDALAACDTRGILPPRIHCGALGPRAGAIGAAFHPITAAHFTEAPLAP